MKKFPFFLVLVFIIGCDKNEDLTSKSQALNNPMQLYIINGDIEYYSEITDGSKPKKPILIYDIPDKINEINGNVTSKKSGESTTLNFHYGIEGSTKSGCTVKVYDDGKSYYTDKGVYGPTPYNKNGYLIRGYGAPHHNFYYNSLILKTSNKGLKTITTRGKPIHDNISEASAISIEYPFKANVSYEIEVQTYFIDNRYLISKVNSNGFPTLHAQLKDTGIIMEGDAGCDNNLIRLITENNYIKSYTIDSPAQINRTITFKFSPLEKKNAIIFTLHPTRGQRGTDTLIPTNDFTMALYSVKINETTFDPANNEAPRGRGNL